ncbi:MAG TPA: pyridoxamine 5'-phosphate oxidase family protein [Microbacteriaceae bacterium]
MERSAEAGADDRRREPDGGPSPDRIEYNDESRELSAAECWDVLGTSGIGHLASRSRVVGVDIVPINYLAVNHQLFFRSGPGSKMENLAAHPHVAVQVEHFQDGSWFSVVVKGKAVRMAADATIESSGIQELVPAQPGEKLNYVCITPDEMTGRTFVPRS